jgi:serine/threonine protein kinase/tetratricopeptide (TPR) repeat protein
MEQLPLAEEQKPLAAAAAEAPVHPLINHRYAIIRKLGEGGSSEVFLVADILRKNHRYAMKVLHGGERGFAVDEKAFGNEVSSLVGLHHPHLVRVFDFGRVLHVNAALVGRRFIAMEYVEGTDLLTWCRSIGDARSRHIFIRAFLLQILSALDYVHREGVIHYDIKPDNLLVVGDESSHPPLVKLTDFGFSKIQGEENTRIRGTLEYTAPELLRGDEHDARVDLYSLGVTLYQLLEGVCPFRAETPVELIKTILTGQVSFPPPGRNTGAGLRSIAQTLMSRNPGHRFLSARIAARAVSGRANGQNVTDFQRNLRPAFAGRVDELSTLKTIFHLLSNECRDREADGRTPIEIQITGSDGSGKTTLLDRAITEARKLDLPVIVLEEYDPTIPFHAVSALLRVLYSWGLSHSHESRNVARRVESLFPGDVATKDIAPPAQTGKESESIIGAIVRFFTEWSDLFPFLLVMDDADRLDRESRMVIDSLRTQAGPGRLLIIETRNEVPPPLEDNRTLQIVLPELGPDDAVFMSRSVFGASPFADELGRFLHLQYGGMPAVLVESLHAVANMPLSEQRQTGEHAAQYVRSLGDSLPQDLDQFVLKRVRGLNRENQIIIEFLSCFRNPVRIDILESLLPYRAERSRDHRLRLESYGYVTLSEGFRRCAIRQERLKAAVYGSLASTWVELHGYIAKAMQHLDLAGSLMDLEELAYQLSRYGDHARASLFFEQAGEAGISNSSFDHAIRLFREALACNDVEKSRARSSHLKLRIAASQLQGGLYRDAIETAEGILDVSAGTARAQLMKILGLAQSRIGQHEKAKLNLLAALAESPSASDQLELQQELIGIDIALGNFAEAEEACRIQLEKAQLMENENVRAGILTDLGIVTFYQDRFDEAASYFRGSMEIYTALNRPMKVIDALCNIGNALSVKGDNAKAIEYWSTALHNSEEYGTLIQQTQLLNNIGIAYFRLNDFPRARKHYHAAHDMSLRTASLNHEAFTLTNLGELAFADGEYEQALAIWTEALTLYTRMDDAQGLVDTLLQLGELHLVLGNTLLADTELGSAKQLIEERRLESFTGRLHYLSGLHDVRLRQYEDALLELDRAIDAFAPLAEAKNYHAARVARAECLRMLGDTVNAGALLTQILHDPEMADHPQVFAEALYLMGMMARQHNATLNENPLVCFRQGLSAITSEPVSEITWRLSFALGKEYHERGHRERGDEFLGKARLVLQYFSGKFKSDTLRAQYLDAGGREEALDAIAAIVQH